MAVDKTHTSDTNIRLEYTSAATGNWTDPTKWTPNGIPGNGDTVVINNHTITVPNGTSATIGYSPDAGAIDKAISVQGTGQLIIDDNATLICRGDMDTENDFEVGQTNGGAIFRFDATQADNPASTNYKCDLGRSANDNAVLSVRGTVSNPCKIESVSGGGNGYFDDGAGLLKAGNIDAQGCDFTRIGTAAISGFTIHGGSSTDKILLTDCIFDACGEFKNPVAMDPAFTLRIVRCTWKNSLLSTNMIDLFNYSNPTGDRILTDSIFDFEYNFISGWDFVITGCQFHDGNTFAGEQGPWTTFEDNFVYGENQIVFYPQGDVKKCVIVHGGSPANPNTHSMREPVGISATTIEDNVYCMLNGPGSDEDNIGIPGTSSITHAITINRNIVLARPNGNPGGTLFSAQGHANLTITSTRNTFWFNTTAGYAKAGETYKGHAGILAEFTSNLGIATDAPNGWILVDSGSNDLVVNAITEADYNGISVTISDAYEPKNNAFASTPGVNDVTAPPQFLDPSRTILTWDTLFGGPGTIANALAELAKQNDRSGSDSNYSVSSLYNYLRNGCIIKQSNFGGAGKSGLDIGAMYLQGPVTQFKNFARHRG